jgi:hypothetical protein
LRHSETKGRATRGAEREALHGLSGTVAHWGSTIAGAFFWTLTCTDIFSGLPECAPIWSKLADGFADVDATKKCDVVGHA